MKGGGAKKDAVAVGMDNVAQMFVQLLERRGIPALFANSGTDFTPIIDALARYGDSLKMKVVLGTHENTVISMAHGYSLVSGKPTALMNHVTVGSANMGCGIMNASRSKVPLLVCAGRTPWFDSGMKGSRTNFVQWGQDSYDQEGYFREYLKWDYELKHSHHFDVVVDRALAIAQSEPKGPVYLSLPKEVLEMGLPVNDGSCIVEEPHMQPDQPTVASDEALDKAASLLLQSKKPIILTGEIGRFAGATEAVAAFCKEFGIGVVESGKRNYLNCNTEEPIHLGFDPRNHVNQADAIIVLECQVPWIPNFGIQPAQGVPIIQMGCDPLWTEIPMRAFKSSLSVAGNPVLSLNRLAEILRKKQNASSFLAGAKDRLKAVSEEHAKIFTKAREGAKKEGEGEHITKAYVSYCMGVALDDKEGDNTIIFNEYPLDHSLVPRRKPNSWFENSNASGLGWSFGACIGGKLASPESTVVCAVGDGSFLFNNPVACHHAASAEKAPVLVVVFNDNGYSTIRKSTMGYKGQSPWCESTGRMPLTFFDNASVDYAMIAEACGGIGRRVSKPKDVLPSIQEALHMVRSGDKHVLLDVRCMRD